MSLVGEGSLLGVALPADDPAGSARVADDLVAAADRVATLGRRVTAMLPVHRWSGLASHEADRRLATAGLALARERSRLLAAAEALSAFSRAVALADGLADEARRLASCAQSAQQAADLHDPAAAVARTGGWGGHRADGSLVDPQAVALLDRARRQAYESRATYDRAAARLSASLSALSGRRVRRAGLSPRVLLDLAGFVPVVGDAVDLANAAVYAAQGRWSDATLTAAAAVPGPAGWAAGAARVARAAGAAGDAGDVVRVVDGLSPQQRVADLVAGLSERGRRPTTRILPDDDAVEAFYRRRLAPLGTTRVTPTPRGAVLLTTLPGGGRIGFRRFSGTGGATIQILDLDELPVSLIHRTVP